jgi:regulator of protease activity HflC (stomatin/prohibitin superfamily)
MSITSIVVLAISGIVGLALIVSLFQSFFTVKQGTVAVVTRLGKFHKICTTGLNFKVPYIDSLLGVISLQNRSASVAFQSITSDQANVYFNAMLLYSATNSDEDTIKNIAFKFRTEQEFASTLQRTIEGAVRAYVATKKQAEVLTLRREIVDHVKAELDGTLHSWGYHLSDLQINDITFDKAIMDSMSKVVASNNLKAAAENEGQALYIQKTKAAEAEGQAIKIQAEAEATAAQLRGQGVAKFREEVAKGLTQSAEMLHSANMDTNVIMFSMWTEAIKNFAEYGKGNVIFLDGSAQGMDNTLKQIQAMIQSKQADYVNN